MEKEILKILKRLESKVDRIENKLHIVGEHITKLSELRKLEK